MPATYSLTPNRNKSVITIPDSTPELLRAYAVNKRQQHFSLVRYNSIIQLFCGIICWSLQSNVLAGMPAYKKMHVLMDELYVGFDNYGYHHAIILIAFEDAVVTANQLRSASTYLGNHFRYAHHHLIALESLSDHAFALLGLQAKANKVVIASERHFELVKATELKT
jgi:hypothetical protein